MLYQITAAVGPAEYAIATTKLYESLKKEYPSIIEIQSYRSYGLDNIYHTIFFYYDKEIKDLCGTIKWVCKSPIRPNNKRKNWFTKVVRILEFEELGVSLSEENFKFEPYRLNNNGVVLIHIPTGTRVISYKESSQEMNRKIAMEKLKIELYMKYKRTQEDTIQEEQCFMERGNEVRIYKGESFKRVK